jgi:hypothetical protein
MDVPGNHVEEDCPVFHVRAKQRHQNPIIPPATSTHISKK